MTVATHASNHSLVRRDARIITKHGIVAAAALLSVLFGVIRSFINQSSVLLLNYSPCGRRWQTKRRRGGPGRSRPWRQRQIGVVGGEQSENAWTT